ncbi:MAG: hypothetical protein J6C94_07480 [Alistipes sp.]|nr:hypothetical protein [Alistipes sp.]MBP3433619.1 hypothetical protein [Alistipes sp.]MBQ8774675.1 hypothetical protein [Alistipes sp.]
MKKIFVVVLLSLMSISCENEMNIDWAPFRIEFVILDSDGENIVLKDAEARSNVFIIYNNSRYICKELTRDVGYNLALTTTGSANEIFVFGDWSLNTDGSFRVRYGEQNWLVDFESYASFSDNNDDDINVMVDGVPGEKYIDSGDYHISMNGEVIFKSGVYILRVK